MALNRPERTSAMLSKNQIKTCNKCGAEITFAQSHSGKWYPADVDRSSGKPEIAYRSQGGFVRGKQRNTTFPQLHQCKPSRAEIQAVIDRLRAELAQNEADLEAAKTTRWHPRVGEWVFDSTDTTRQAIIAWERKLEEATR